MDSVTSPGDGARVTPAQTREEALAAAAARVAGHLSLEPPTAHLVLVVLSGLPGTGKSHLARRLQPHLAATIVETDHVRHILFRSPCYSGGENAWVYAVCHRLITQLLAMSRSVIFDATNLLEDKRKILYGIAEKAGARLVIVRTVAPEPIIHERLHRRSEQGDPGNHSDADLAVYAQLRQTEQPIRRSHILIDTTQEIEQSVQRIVHACFQPIDETHETRTALPCS